MFAKSRSFLVQCILKKKETLPDSGITTDVVIMDGSALVNILVPRTSKTFAEYAEKEFLPKIKASTEKYLRCNVVLDTYPASSLKAETRSRRGEGSRRRVSETEKLPRNWRNFLRHSENKTELFQYLADKVIESCFQNWVVVTKGPHADAFSNRIDIDLAEISPCNHKEADTRMFLHFADAVNSGFTTAMVKANDTDILVIGVAMFLRLREAGLHDLWITNGQGCHLKWIPIHELTTALSPEKFHGLFFFHAFTGCDTVSVFRGKGKKSAWQTWEVLPYASDVFTKLSSYPPMIEDEDIKIIEKFVVTMYDRSSKSETVDKARLELFARIDPTRIFCQHMQLLLSIQNVQLSRQLAYGVVLWIVKLDKRLLLNGVG